MAKNKVFYSVLCLAYPLDAVDIRSLYGIFYGV